MNGKIIAAVAAGTMVACLQAQSPSYSSLHQFNRRVRDQGVTLEQVINFLRKNQSDPALCKSVGFTLEMWHDPHYDKEAWRKFAGQFFDLALRCSQSEQEKQDDLWLEAFGPSFEKIYRYIREKKGLSYGISISTELHKLKMDVAVYHDDEYDAANWQEIISQIVTILEDYKGGNYKDEKENIAFLQRVMPIVGDSIARAGDQSGIHGVLESKINDTTNNWIGATCTT